MKYKKCFFLFSFGFFSILSAIGFLATGGVIMGVTVSGNQYLNDYCFSGKGGLDLITGKFQQMFKGPA